MLLEHHQTLVFSKVLCSIAPSTYIIYLFHTTFEGFTKAVIHKIPAFCDTSSEVMFTLGAVVVVFIGIVGPIALHKYVLSRFKITRFMFGLK
ncbi:hypothetical protein CIK91_00880 [Segatella bryantii]|uniref:Uncharacterized protein n=2 Tax=Segatella bryantii TaxID=77095 RepID=A0ABX4EKE2_SEGBR|nr:hypothetical protein CIK91_00880 [Segatella bryantii]